MSDMADVFNYRKKMQQEKRAANREHSPTLLTAAGIKFESKNMDAHLIVQSNAALIDFWPGTGKWIVRKGKTGRGVRGLIAYIKKASDPKASKP